MRVPPPKGVRIHLIAGTQHGGRAHLTTAPGPCVTPRNPHSPAPVLRALIVALDQWATGHRAARESRTDARRRYARMPSRHRLPRDPGD
jgi:hypothetical protein